MNSKIKIEGKKPKNLAERNDLDRLERPYPGCRDIEEALAEMRAAHEKMTDEDHQKAEG